MTDENDLSFKESSSSSSSSLSFYDCDDDVFDECSKSEGKVQGISACNSQNEKECAALAFDFEQQAIDNIETPERIYEETSECAYLNEEEHATLGFDFEQQAVGNIDTSERIYEGTPECAFHNEEEHTTLGFDIEQQPIDNIEKEHSPSSALEIKCDDSIDCDHQQRVNRNLVITTSETEDDTGDQNTFQLASPQIRKNQLLPLESPSSFQRSKRKGIFPLESKKTKLRASKMVPPLASFFIGVLALTAGIINRQSHDFVKLSTPIIFDDRYQEVYKLGLYYIEVCRADKLVSLEVGSQSVSITELEYENDDQLDGHPVSEKMRSISMEDFQTKYLNKITDDPDSSASNEESICRRLPISSFSISDNIWNLSRITAGISQWVGTFSLVLLLGSTVSENVNLIIVYSLIFLSYILQGSVFFFYDSSMCQTYGCSFSSGTYYAISAVVCWFLSGLGVLMLNSAKKRNLSEKENGRRNKSVAVNAGFQWNRRTEA